MPNVISIMEDPSGPVYHELLRLAVSKCAFFSLVWRDHIKFEPGAEKLREHLNPFKVEQARTSRWPGNELTGYRALVMTCHLTPRSIPILKTSPSLFGWQPPKLPQDLAFYTADKSCWLATITAHREAYFVGGDLRVELLQDLVPELKVKSEDIGPQFLRLLKPDREHRPPLPS